MDISDDWVAKVRVWAEATPEVVSVTAYGSRVTGVRRQKPDPLPVPDLDLAIQTKGDEWGTAYGHFYVLRNRWQTDLQAALGVPVDIRHHDPSDPDDDVTPYLAAGSRSIWPQSS